MDNFQIETAQNVTILQNIAGVGERILAFLIDSLIIMAYYIVASFFLRWLPEVSLQESWVYSLTLGLPVILYHLLWEMLWNGRSPGKAAMQLRVVKLDGSRPAFSSYFLRWLLRIVDISVSFGGVALFTIMFTKSGQRIGDMAATTTVISEKNRIRFMDIVGIEVPENYQPKYSQVTVFNDSEMREVKQIYNQARMQGSHRVILKLADRVAKLMDVTFEEKPMAFLETVLKDYNHYTQRM